MKRILIGALIIAIQGCANEPKNTEQVPPSSCVGTTIVAGDLSSRFKLVQDSAFLAQAIGEPLKGKLCQGAVYESTDEVTVYRAWNSTNPHSEFGQWWSFQFPSGNTAKYRENYEICYQWSPLDKLVKCTLKVGTKVVVGNGQSARCSEYLSYPVSEKQQVFITNASDAVENCESYDSVMSWK
ncbi:hypothetical protein [Vibrio spartinae]|uniref:Lipoprotein n=1 Tax=Vibrio spartinae TaxID=1918945 RepID=A0A1N6M1T1_9VIBR|nr:hypothetical protein [Vibrio spartinae]QMV15470.1 hypothetical protein Vspart_02777 [Vibrio spartinae]SIO93337.1 hypothetical protein VSP9026_00996 [Vibrio spartinae]